MSSSSQQQDSGDNFVRIRLGKVDSLSLYEITEHELETLASGTPSSLLLNLAIALLSVGVSFLIALVTPPEMVGAAFTVFVAITTASFIAGIVLMCLWYQSRQPISALVNKIKSRISEEEVDPTERFDSD